MNWHSIKYRFRHFVWKQKLNHLGERTLFMKDVTIDYPKRVSIGHKCTLNKGVYLGGKGGIYIGNNVHISPYAQLHTGKLITKDNNFIHVYAPIVLHDNVWIASGAVIGCGVTIGEHSIIGANCVITKDVPPNFKITKQ